jgi:hypothetical protein
MLGTSGSPMPSRETGTQETDSNQQIADCLQGMPDIVTCSTSSMASQKAAHHVQDNIFDAGQGRVQHPCHSEVSLLRPQASVSTVLHDFAPCPWYWLQTAAGIGVTWPPVWLISQHDRHGS